ncbi:unnamed protein product, partial [Prorocentrum cordatum]
AKGSLARSHAAEDKFTEGLAETVSRSPAMARSWDLMPLNGTQKRALPDQAEERHNHIRHWIISCGYKKGRLINSSCGLSFLVTHRIRIKLELKEYTAALKILRNKDLARRREELVQEIWEAYQVNMEKPSSQSEIWEARKIREAEEKEGQEELDKYTTLAKFQVGRKLLEKMGWSIGETLLQTPRMTPDKYVWPPGSAGQSTPWAAQFREDMGELVQVDESMSVWYNARASDLDIFLPGGSGSGDVPVATLPKGKGGKKARQHGNAAGGDIVQAVMAVQSLSIRTAAVARDLPNIVGEFWLAPPGHDIIEAAKETGSSYNEKVQSLGKGHGLGPPCLHVSVAAIEAMATSLGENEQEGAQAKISITQWVEQAESEAGQAFVGKTILMFKVSDTFRADDEMDDGNRMAKVMFALSPRYDIATAMKQMKIQPTGAKPPTEFNGVRLLQAMGVALHRAGGHRPVGGGPKEELDRVVERQLMALQKKCASTAYLCSASGPGASA